MDLPEPKCYPIVWDEKIPKPGQEIDKGYSVSFVDATNKNELTKERYNNRFPYTLSVGEFLPV